MPHTISERLFETFCQAHLIPFTRIDVPGKAEGKRPDYEISTKVGQIIVEVKEIDQNAEDIESMRLLHERGYGKVMTSNPGDRIRLKIASASPQIKARSKGKIPSILCIFAQASLAAHLEPHCVRSAMFGQQEMVVAVPIDLAESPYLVGSKLGGKRKMTKDCNRSISAIATMYYRYDGTLLIALFHNHFAVNRIPSKAFPPDVEQYYLRKSSRRLAPDWVKFHRG